ncbi:MAG: tRNA (adenosine(37)-N6)-threonylcarbamoyltransferase complex transferase subunit TsaD [Patescibacteria group bacterium]|jgi:N6-L-threonylcarbamoyladenine synthase
MRRLRVLGIETSCDETSVALLEVGAKSVKILHHETASQIAVHAIYGGVVPEVAARLHVAELVALLDRALGTPLNEKKFDAIAVTKGPGLATALRVGVEAARTLAFVTGKPVVGVNHLEGHLASAWLVEENRTRWKFPILTLLVSGGHTELVLMKDFGKYQVLGRTRDDAAGEAFDKTAKLMGLEYPGGPMIAKLAEKGDPKAFDLPRPMMHDPSLDFSFSGLKSAVRRTWEELPEKKRKDKKVIADLAASIQAAIVDVLISKTAAAIKKAKPKAITIVGGVSANRELHERMKKTFGHEIPILEPARGLHTDNAAMIAAAGAWSLMRGKKDNWKKLDADPEMDL